MMVNVTKIMARVMMVLKTTVVMELVLTRKDTQMILAQQIAVVTDIAVRTKISTVLAIVKLNRKVTLPVILETLQFVILIVVADVKILLIAVQISLLTVQIDQKKLR